MASPSRDKTVYNFNVVRWLEKHHRKKKISKHDLDAAKIVELRGIFEALDDDDSGSKATCGAFLKTLPHRSSRLCLCSHPTRVPTRAASVRPPHTRCVVFVRGPPLLQGFGPPCSSPTSLCCCKTVLAAKYPNTYCALPFHLLVKNAVSHLLTRLLSHTHAHLHVILSAIEIVELYDAIQRVGAMAPLLAAPQVGDDGSGIGLGDHAAQQLEARTATAQLNTEEYSYTPFIPPPPHHACCFFTKCPARAPLCTTLLINNTLRIPSVWSRNAYAHSPPPPLHPHLLHLATPL